MSEERRKILSNKIMCLHCGQTVESKYRHDFQYCPCGKVYVDGGKDYLRRGFPNGTSKEHYKELSEWEPK